MKEPNRNRIWYSKHSLTQFNKRIVYGRYDREPGALREIRDRILVCSWESWGEECGAFVGTDLCAIVVNTGRGPLCKTVLTIPMYMESRSRKRREVQKRRRDKRTIIRQGAKRERKEFEKVKRQIIKR